MPPSKKEDVTSSLSKLKLDPIQKPGASKPKKKPVADSWEDESSESENEAQPSSLDDLPTSPPPRASSGAKAPPPTPISPTYRTGPSTPWDAQSSGPSSGLASPDEERRRPEKTDAVARRMIAGALGIKAPRMTEEQRAYDRSVKEKERKRREQEKAAERQRELEAEKAKASMWDD